MAAPAAPNAWLAVAVPGGGGKFASLARPRSGRLLRNGNVADIEPVHITGGIHDAYHWITVNMARDAGTADIGGLDPTEAVRRTAALYHIRLAAMAGAANAAKARELSLALAAGRYAITFRHEIVDADLINAQVNTVNGEWTPVLGANPTWAPAAAAPAEYTAAEVNGAYTAIGAIDEDYITKAGLAAVGTAVTTGVIVYMTKGHHYVEPHKGISDAVVKQVLGKNMDNFGTLDVDTIKDVLCHKMSHPVANTVLTGMALDVNMVARMSALNLASSVVRVPARSDAERRGDSFLAVVDKITPTLPMLNVSVGTLRDDLEAVITAGRTAIRAAVGNAGRLNAESQLREDLKRFEGAVAFLYGAYGVMVEDENNNSLMRAPGLKNIKEEHRAQASYGADRFRQGRTWSNERVRHGTLNGLAVYGAIAPPAMRPPPEENPMAALAPLMAALAGARAANP